MSFHSFNVDIAKKYGINIAVILQNLLFWTEKKLANCQLEDDGLAYIYNSVSAWQKLFPYLSEKQIRCALNTLENDGYLVSRQDLNQSSMDRTKHYALTEKALQEWLNTNEINGKMQDNKRDACIVTKGQMDSDKMAVATEPKVKLLTDNKHTDINTDIKHIKKIPKKDFAQLDYSCWPELPDQQILDDWFDLRKRLRSPVSQTVINRFGNELTKAARHGYTVDQCLTEVITRGWRGFDAQWLINRESGNHVSNQPIVQANAGGFVEKHTDTSWAL